MKTKYCILANCMAHIKNFTPHNYVTTINWQDKWEESYPSEMSQDEIKKTILNYAPFTTLVDDTKGDEHYVCANKVILHITKCK